MSFGLYVIFIVVLALLVTYAVRSYLPRTCERQLPCKTVVLPLTSNHSSSVVPLYNVDFTRGTYRILQPGRYKLMEDIWFDPPEHALSMYQAQSAAYMLGFFAAVTIECDRVDLNLNGFSIQQSKRHLLRQRFFSCIELGPSPFMNHQGPVPFTTEYFGVRHITIHHGTLGRSAHHGIHGNCAQHLHLHHLQVRDFEVSGIALNGCVHVRISDAVVGPAARTVPCSTSFSHAISLLHVLSRKSKCLDTHVDGIGTGHEVRAALQSAVDDFERQGLQSPYVSLFGPVDGPFDANMYGIVLNCAGVAVNQLPTSRDVSRRHLLGNQQITLERVTVSSIYSVPVELHGLSAPGRDASGYGLNVQRDLVGAVFNVDACSEAGTYTGTVLSNVQIWAAAAMGQGAAHKPTHGCPFVGSGGGGGTIAPSIIRWACERQEVDVPSQHDTVGGGDGMAHVMKGNIGILISQALQVTMNEVQVHDVTNGATEDSSRQYFHHQDPNIIPCASFGILVNSSEDVVARGLQCTVDHTIPHSHGWYLAGDCVNVHRE